MKSLGAGETDARRPNTKITQCADIGLRCIGLQSFEHLEDRINVVFVFPLAHFHALEGATRRTEHGGWMASQIRLHIYAWTLISALGPGKRTDRTSSVCAGIWYCVDVMFGKTNAYIEIRTAFSYGSRLQVGLTSLESFVFCPRTLSIATLMPSQNIRPLSTDIHGRLPMPRV
jgi:hypothetical protein